LEPANVKGRGSTNQQRTCVNRENMQAGSETSSAKSLYSQFPQAKRQS
jgi:hypothetical protein